MAAMILLVNIVSDFISGSLVISIITDFIKKDFSEHLEIPDLLTSAFCTVMLEFEQQGFSLQDSLLKKPFCLHRITLALTSQQ